MRCSGVTSLAEPVRAGSSVWTKELSPRRAYGWKTGEFGLGSRSEASIRIIALVGKKALLMAIMFYLSNT